MQCVVGSGVWSPRPTEGMQGVSGGVEPPSLRVHNKKCGGYENNAARRGLGAPPCVVFLLFCLLGGFTAGAEGLEIQLLDLGRHGFCHDRLPVDLRTA